jgi:hypothetical protein
METLENPYTLSDRHWYPSATMDLYERLEELQGMTRLLIDDVG